MTLAHLISFAISLSIALFVLGLALTAKLQDATYLIRHPDLFIRSVLAMNVVMPIIAAVAVAVLNLDPAIEIAIVALALSPVPPVLSIKQRKADGSEAFAVGILATMATFAIIIVPLGIELIAWISGKDLHVSMATVASVVFVSVLLPLAIGLVVHEVIPAFAQRIAGTVSVAGVVLLVAAFIPALIQIWPALVAVVSSGTILVLVVFALVGVAVGHYLGGPDTDNRTVLALAASTRHPGVALAIAGATFPDVKGVLAVVLWHLVVGAIVTLPYVNWRRQAHASRSHRRDLFADPHPHG